jgi:hypothetical protein
LNAIEVSINSKIGVSISTCADFHGHARQHMALVKLFDRARPRPVWFLLDTGRDLEIDSRLNQAIEETIRIGRDHVFEHNNSTVVSAHHNNDVNTYRGAGEFRRSARRAASAKT